MLYTYFLFNDIFYFYYYLHCTVGFSGVSSAKEPTCQCWSCKRNGFDPWSGRPLEEGVATCSSILTWRISWTEEPDMLQSMESQRIRHNWSDLADSHFTCVYFFFLLENGSCFNYFPFFFISMSILVLFLTCSVHFWVFLLHVTC